MPARVWCIFAILAAAPLIAEADAFASHTSEEQRGSQATKQMIPPPGGSHNAEKFAKLQFADQCHPPLSRFFTFSDSLLFENARRIPIEPHFVAFGDLAGLLIMLSTMFSVLFATRSKQGRPEEERRQNAETRGPNRPRSEGFSACPTTDPQWVVVGRQAMGR